MPRYFFASIDVKCITSLRTFFLIDPKLHNNTENTTQVVNNNFIDKLYIRAQSYWSIILGKIAQSFIVFNTNL